jgi:hypothetical protein
LRTNNEISELFTEFVKKFLIQKNKAEFFKVDSHGGIRIKEDFYSKLTNEWNNIAKASLRKPSTKQEIQEFLASLYTSQTRIEGITMYPMIFEYCQQDAGISINDYFKIFGIKFKRNIL